ncbi:MAG: heme-binding protein, partial [Burkholderiales bacterium]
MKMLSKWAAAVLVAGIAVTARAGLTEKKVLTLEAAKSVAAAAAAEAKRRGSTVVIVVVDDAGHPIYLERLDDTQVA